MTLFRLLAWSALVAPGLAAPPPPRETGRCDDGLKPIKRISLGPRPYWLVDNMDEGPLKTKLASCSEKEMKRSDWCVCVFPFQAVSPRETHD
jgi:glycerophosphoryl diester phosphodiesterase